MKEPVDLRPGMLVRMKWPDGTKNVYKVKVCEHAEHPTEQWLTIKALEFEEK